MAGYNLYQSSNITSFIQNLPELFENDIFSSKPTALIVQNKNMGEWFKLALASQTGIFCGLDIRLPEDAMRLLLESFVPDESEQRNLLFIDNLKILIFKELERILSSSDTKTNQLFAPLIGYISKDNQGRKAKKLFQLSDAIAGLFNSYAMNAPDLIKEWVKGNQFFKNEQNPDEAWQAELWRNIFGKEGNYTHIGRLISTVREEKRELAPTRDLPFSRIILLGSSFLGESGLNLFKYVSQFVDVHHLAFTPSLTHTPSFTDQSLANSENTNYNENTNLILSKCGSLTKGLKEITDHWENLNSQHFFLGSDTQNSVDKNSDTALLKQIQQAIINDKPLFDLTLSENEHISPSLRIHGCIGAKREMEQIRCEILKILDNDPTIQLTDISVMAPNINDYAPHILSLFPSFDSNGKAMDQNIPFNLIDLNAMENLPFVEGFKMLLNIPGSRFKRSEMFNLFNNPCFIEGFSLRSEDPEAWLNLVDKAYIKWGYNSENQNEAVPENNLGDSNTWEGGFSRIIEGFVFTEASGLTTVEPEGKEDIAAAGRMIWAVRKIFADLSDLSRRRLSLKEWILLIESIMENYLGCRPAGKEDDRDGEIDIQCRSTIKRVFRDIIHIDSDLNELDGYSDKTFPFSVIRTLITEKIEGQGGSRGRYLTNGVTCSSLKPLRSIPFKIIFLCGINGGAFPKKRIMPGFDLSDKLKLKIDSSSEAGDRFSFLEALMGAEQELIITYREKNEITGEAMPPSVLITELLAPIPEGILKEIVTHEKVQPFDSDYFKGDNRQSFIQADYNAAIAYFKKENKYKEGLPAIFTSSGTSPSPAIEKPPLPETISIQELIRFVKDPIQNYFRNLFNLYLREYEDITEDDNESRDPKFFELIKLYQDFYFVDPHSNPDKIENLVKKEIEQGALIKGISETLFKEKIIDRLDTIQIHTNPVPENLSKETTISFAVEKSKDRTPGAATIEREAPKIKLAEGEIALEGEIKNIRKIISSEDDNQTNHWYFYRLCHGGKPSIKHLLQPYIESLILASTGEDKSTLIISGNDAKKDKDGNFKGKEERNWNHTQEQATKQLSELVSLFLENRNKPIPLTPVLAEKFIAKETSKDKLSKEVTILPMGNDRIAKLFPQLWKEILTAKQGGDRGLQESLYINHFFSRNIPPYDPKQIDRFLETLYRRLV